ncbi:hypothetical protein ACJX0J_008957, partial [Zea mays]
MCHSIYWKEDIMPVLVDIHGSYWFLCYNEFNIWMFTGHIKLLTQMQRLRDSTMIYKEDITQYKTELPKYHPSDYSDNLQIFKHTGIFPFCQLIVFFYYVQWNVYQQHHGCMLIADVDLFLIYAKSYEGEDWKTEFIITGLEKKVEDLENFQSQSCKEYEKGQGDLC